MKSKRFCTLIALLVTLLFLSSCGADTNTGNTSTATEKAEVKRIDSLSVEMDKTTKKIEVKTEKMKEDIDKLLEGI